MLTVLGAGFAIVISLTTKGKKAGKAQKWD